MKHLSIILILLLASIAQSRAIKEHWEPWDTDTYDIGINAARWRTGYFSGNIFADFPIDPNHLATKKYVDLAIGASFDLFLSDTDDGVVADTHVMFPLETGEAESTEVSGTLTAGVDDQLALSWLSEAGVPGTLDLRAGIYDCHIHLNKNSGGATTDVYWTLSFVDADGSTGKTLVTTSEIQERITTSAESYDIHAVVREEILTGVTKRLLFELYGNISNGQNVTITATLEGSTDAHITFTLPSSVWQHHGEQLDNINAGDTVTFSGAAIFEAGLTTNMPITLNPDSQDYDITIRAAGNSAVIEGQDDGLATWLELFTIDGTGNNVGLKIFGAGQILDVSDSHSCHFAWSQGSTRYEIETLFTGVGGVQDETSLALVPNLHLIANPDGTFIINSDWEAASETCSDIGIITTGDWNAGTVDATIGGTTPAAGTFTDLTATSIAAPTKGTANYLVATNDSPATAILQADFLGDGDSDDVQIQAAIDATAADGGGMVYAAEGTYDLDAAIEMKQGVRLIGSSSGGTEFSLGAGSPTSFIRIDAISHCEVANIELDGNGDNTAMAAIRFTGDSASCSDNIIRNIYAHDLGTLGDGILVETNAAQLWPLRIKIVDCYFTNSVAGNPEGDDGFDLNSMSDSEVIRCTIEGFNDNGIDTDGGRNLKVLNTTVANCDGHGIEIEQTLATFLDSQDEMWIKNCTIRDCDGTNKYGIYVFSGTNSVIEGCLIKDGTHGVGDFGDDGAGFDDSTGNIVDNCTFRNLTGNGIEETGDGDLNQFTNNIFDNVSGSNFTVVGSDTRYWGYDITSNRWETNQGVEIDRKLVANGSVMLGDGGDNFSVASDGIDIDTSGNITNAGTIGSGAITSTGVVGGTDLTASDDIIGQDDLQLDSDAAIIQLGEDQDVTITHVHDTGILVNLGVEVDGALDADGVVTLGDGGDNFSVASDGVDIDTSGNFTNVGNVSGSDIDISAGTGGYSSSGTIDSGSVDVTGTVLVGDGTLPTGGDDLGDYNIESYGTGKNVGLWRYATGATNSAAIEFHRGKGTADVPLTATDNTELGSILFRGWNEDGAEWDSGAEIRVRVDGTNDTGDTSDMPSEMEFMTSPDNSSIPVVRMTIKPDGTIEVGEFIANTRQRIEWFVDTAGYAVTSADKYANMCRRDGLALLAFSATRGYKMSRDGCIMGLAGTCNWTTADVGDSVNLEIWTDGAAMTGTLEDAELNFASPAGTGDFSPMPETFVHDDITFSAGDMLSLFYDVTSDAEGSAAVFDNFTGSIEIHYHD